MRERSPRNSSVSIDVVLVTVAGDELAILLSRKAVERERWAIPWKYPAPGESLSASASHVAREALGATPIWIEQLGAFADGKRHPGDADVSIAFVALVPHETAAPANGLAWFPMRDLPVIALRQRAMVDTALTMVGNRLDQSPIAFRLLPETFTLSDLQQMYELLLGKRLHKASFRRALQAAWLVEATEEWRSEGRGRPAQLYRYAPRKKRRSQRGVRFELLQP